MIQNLYHVTTGCYTAAVLQLNIDHPILDAAEVCFDRHGVRRTTVEDIAAEAGVSRVTVYRQIGNRDEIVLHTLLRVTDRFLRRTRPRLLACRDLADALTELVMATLRAARRDDVLLLFASEEHGATGRPIPGASTPLFALYGETVTLLEGELDGTLREGTNPAEAGEWVLRIVISLLTIPAPTRRSQAETAALVRGLITGGLCSG